MSNLKCSVEICPYPAKVRGWCSGHYSRWRETGDIRADVPLRKRSDIVHENDWAICSFIPCGRIARACGLCQAHRRQQREGKELTPIKNQGPKGEGTHDRNGYRVIRSKETGVKMEHRMVMASILKRPLLPEETVHHLNGQRDDNSPSNLELWSSRQPKGQRVVDKLQWAFELIELYEGTDEIAEARSRVPSSCVVG